MWTLYLLKEVFCTFQVQGQSPSLAFRMVWLALQDAVRYTIWIELVFLFVKLILIKGNVSIQQVVLFEPL